MKTWKGVVLAIGILSTIFLSVFGIVPSFLHTDSTYKGQETFLSQQSYDTFKADVKMRIYEDNLTLESFDVLASEPPIIVNFEVVTPYDYNFPYGESHSHNADLVIISYVVLVASFFFIVLPCFAMFDWG